MAQKSNNLKLADKGVVKMKSMAWYVAKIKKRPLRVLVVKALEYMENTFYYILSRLFLYIPGINYLFINTIKYIATTGKGSNICLFAI